MRLLRLASLPLIVFACLGDRPSARTPSLLTLLDRYVAGEFDGVVAGLIATTDFDDLLKQLRRDGPAWIDLRGPAQRDRRQLAAATFALEAARVDEWHEWKWTQKQPPMGGGAGGSYQPLDVLSWKPAPQLIEWGCARFRTDETPRPIERWWQLAALAVAQRGEDAQFLIGDPKIGLGEGRGEIGNLQDEIKHLDHVVTRFPHEARFMLAQGIAREWETDALLQANARVAFEAVQDEPDVGGEATMRLGAMGFRRGASADAIKLFNRAEAMTRDPYVVFLARYFTGQAHERQGHAETAADAYRGAVAAVPNAESASTALATLLFKGGRRVEAQRLAGAMLAAELQPADPWREYAHADDRFWPQLIGRLRAEVMR